MSNIIQLHLIQLYLILLLCMIQIHSPTVTLSLSLLTYRFVISRILHPLDTEDPYADDYYYIQSQIKKNKKLQAEAAEKAAEQAKQMQLGRDMPVHTPDFPPDLIVPLPTWKDAKEKMKLKVINSKRNILNRSKKWTLKEKTLGVQTRGKIYVYMYIYGEMCRDVFLMYLF